VRSRKLVEINKPKEPSVKRIPEPELMTEMEQARVYSEADFEQPHEQFVTLMQQVIAADIDGRAIDLGCGPADVTARVGRAYPRLSIDGIDGAPAMLALGRERLARLALSGRVRLFDCRLPAALPHTNYDVVFSNSLLHHLHDPTVLWNAVKAAATPGSRVFVMDLMRPETIDEARRLVEVYASNEPEQLQLDFFHSLCAAFTVEEVQAQLEAADLHSLSVRPVSDRHLAVAGALGCKHPNSAHEATSTGR
jgi:trans-aconitate methyltransferase